MVVDDDTKKLKHTWVLPRNHLKEAKQLVENKCKLSKICMERVNTLKKMEKRERGRKKRQLFGKKHKHDDFEIQGHGYGGGGGHASCDKHHIEQRNVHNKHDDGKLRRRYMRHEANVKLADDAFEMSKHMAAMREGNLLRSRSKSERVCGASWRTTSKSRSRPPSRMSMSSTARTKSGSSMPSSSRDNSSSSLDNSLLIARRRLMNIKGIKSLADKSPRFIIENIVGKNKTYLRKGHGSRPSTAAGIRPSTAASSTAAASRPSFHPLTQRTRPRTSRI